MDIEYREAQLTTGMGFDINEYWHPRIDAWSPLYRDILEPFCAHKYTCPRLPISMGPMSALSFRKCPSVLRVPIKRGGSIEVRLPQELYPIAGELKRLLQYDRFINPNFEAFHAHVTIDNSRVEPGNTQRFPGFHGDGLQGGKFKTKLIVEHSYVFVDRFPTEFAMQPFFVAHLNEDRYNVFKEFDRQLNNSSIYRGLPGHCYLIDPYMVHASPVITETCVHRTFFRLTLTPAELLMPRNTINPMFDGQGYEERIDVLDFVADPDINVPLDFYGIGE